MKKIPFNFLCKYCNQPTSITEHDYKFETIESPDNLANYKFSLEIIKCPNPDCKKTHVNVNVSKTIIVGGRKDFGLVSISTAKKEVFDETIEVLPEYGVILLPSYLPKDIQRDINEANLIKNKSTRASASLLRRALQSMIRDFWKSEIIPGELNSEITQLKSKITDAALYNAMHSLKNIASFAAHPEKDISSIVDIEKSELDQMFKIIHILIKEWYVNKKEREENLKSLNKMASKKKQQSK